MEIEKYFEEVIKGVKQAFNIDLPDEEVESQLYAFDPMLYGDWSLSIGGHGSELIKLCGQPIEVIMTCVPELPAEMGIDIFAGKTTKKDRSRVYTILETLEENIGEDIMFNDVNEDDPLLLNFRANVNSTEEVSKAITNTINRLLTPENQELTEEMLRLCNK